MAPPDNFACRRQMFSLSQEAHGDAVVRIELVLVRSAENGFLGVGRGEDLLVRQVPPKVYHLFVSHPCGALQEVRDKEGLNIRVRLGLGVSERLPDVGRGVDALAKQGARRDSVAESYFGNRVGTCLCCPVVDLPRAANSVAPPELLVHAVTRQVLEPGDRQDLVVTAVGDAFDEFGHRRRCFGAEARLEGLGEHIGTLDFHCGGIG